MPDRHRERAGTKAGSVRNEQKERGSRGFHVIRPLDSGPGKNCTRGNFDRAAKRSLPSRAIASHRHFVMQLFTVTAGLREGQQIADPKRAVPELQNCLFDGLEEEKHSAVIRKCTEFRFFQLV